MKVLYFNYIKAQYEPRGFRVVYESGFRVKSRAANDRWRSFLDLIAHKQDCHKSYELWCGDPMLILEGRTEYD